MPRICENGIYRDMTPEEIAEMNEQMAEIPEPEMTAEQHFEELESAMMELASMLGGDPNA